MITTPKFMETYGDSPLQCHPPIQQRVSKALGDDGGTQSLNKAGNFLGADGIYLEDHPI